MLYNLDENASIIDFLGLNSPSKIMSIGQRVAIKHYSMFDFSYAFVIDINKTVIKVKFRTSITELDFFPEDPVVVTFMADEKLLIANGEIIAVECLDPLTIDIRIKRVEKRDTLRKTERFYVSLSCQLSSSDSNEPTFGIVKNLSFSGFKVNSKMDFHQNTAIDLNLAVDKYYSILCKGKIVRKNKLNQCYEYGIEIFDISKPNMLALQHYINQLKSGN